MMRDEQGIQPQPRRPMAQRELDDGSERFRQQRATPQYGWLLALVLGVVVLTGMSVVSCMGVALFGFWASAPAPAPPPPPVLPAVPPMPDAGDVPVLVPPARQDVE